MSVTVSVWCNKHPMYKGMRKSSICDLCDVVYDLRHACELDDEESEMGSEVIE